MKGQPLISIIVPVFNLEKYIDRCVKSILRQSYPNIELILVDDGSTDSSAKICKKYCECDPRVQLFRTGNKGVSSARNLGIARAAGVYIAFIDGDDTVEENYIEILYRCLILKNVDIVFCGIRTIYVDKNMVNTFRVDQDMDGFLKNDLGDLYTGKTYLAVGTPVCKLFKKSVILDYNLQFDTTLKNREDSLFAFSYLHFCEKYTATNKTYYNYYKNDRGSATERFDTGRIEADKKYLKFLSHWLEVEKIPHSQEIMASEIVNSIRSLTTSLLKNNASISDSYPISLNFYAQILGGFSLPNTAFQFKTKLVMMALRRRIYTPVFLYYWVKFRRGR